MNRHNSHESLSSWKLMYSEVQQLFLEGYYLSFQNRTIKTQIIHPSLANCPLFCSPSGTLGCWHRLITETLFLLGSKPPHSAPKWEKGHHPPGVVPWMLGQSVPLRTDQAPCYRASVLVPVHTNTLTGWLLENFTALTFKPPALKLSMTNLHTLVSVPVLSFNLHMILPPSY